MARHASTATWSAKWPLFVPALVAALIYARAAWLGLAWDDAPLTVDNPSLGSLHGLWSIWSQETWKATGLNEQTNYYRPVAMTSFWLVARVSNSAAAHHLSNVAIHAFNASLVARVLLRRSASAPLTACLLASFWGVATANSEVVLWISGRFDALVTTFLLLAFLSNSHRRRLALVWFAFALLTKEVAIAWWPVLIVDDLALLRRAWRESWRRWAVMLGLLLGYLALRRAVGIGTDAHGLHALRWFIPAFASIAVRVGAKLFVPVGLDPLQPLHLLSTPSIVATLCALATLTVVVTRRARNPHVLLGIFWFSLSLLPMCLIAPLEPVAGDRYGYAASVGIIVALAGGSAELRSGIAVQLSRISAVLLTAVQGVLTEARIPAWQDRESIATSMARAHPDNAFAHYLLGYVTLERGDLSAAETHLSRSLALERSWRALDAACVLDLRRDRLATAERYCLESGSLHPTNPRVWANLASVYVRAGKWEAALGSAERAVTLKPQYAEAHYLAGVSAANLGLYPLARSHVDAGLSATPSHRALLSLQAALESERAPSPP